MNVMLVDDHTVFREGIKKVIELEDRLEVIDFASDSKELKQKLHYHVPNIILLDIHLKNENGLDLIPYIKSINRHIKIIILTMSDDEFYMKKAFDSGADGYLLKEISGDELINALKQVTSGITPLSPTMTNKLLYPYKQPQQNLTNREREVLNHLAKGMTNKEIAKTLYISDQTVKLHISNIYKKMDVSSRTQAIVYAVEKNMVCI